MMDRLAELIGKLKEQFEQKADTSKLLATTLLIERELMKLESAQPAAPQSSKVSVVMPAGRTPFSYRQESATEEVEVAPSVRTPVPSGTTQEAAPLVRHDSRFAPRPDEDRSTVKDIPEEKPSASPKHEYAFDPMQEIPTLSHQQNVKELNELIGVRDPSLNDKLKENRMEVGHKLTAHPIKDLKKAIGINDRYVFINELFRGDEVMYERSIKTINSFKIFAEAEYWIERELKVKLGWEENKEATRNFYMLVRRRFS